MGAHAPPGFCAHTGQAVIERCETQREKADASSRQDHARSFGMTMWMAWNPASSSVQGLKAFTFCLLGWCFVGFFFFFYFLCMFYTFVILIMISHFFSRGKVKAVSFLLPMDMSSFAEKQGSLKSPQNQSTKQLMTITEKDMWAGEFLKAHWFPR